MLWKIARRATLALAALSASVVVALAQSGSVVGLSAPARLTTSGAVKPLKMGDEVSMGDIVSTGKAGQVQILFPDQTRVVVGPNSELKIQKLLFRSNGTARRMTLNAAAGTFRFLTGESPKRAYRLRTPTATMTVRGTAFDFAVDGSVKDTALVVHEGTVRYCDRHGRCVSVPNGCQTVMIDRLRRFTQPENAEQRLQILRAMFPYARDDSRLEPLFRTFVASCREGDNKSTGQSVAATQKLTQLTLPPDPPDQTIEHKSNPAPSKPSQPFQ